MPNLSRLDKKHRFNHHLVFDTIALLSASNTNPEQVWRNNEQLGACYIPGGTYKELTRIAKSRNNRNKRKANQFLKFLAKGGRYRVMPLEDNVNIPANNISDRQILTCAHQLARDNMSDIVILVTYDIAQTGLVVQSQLPNFCVIEAREIAKWYHNGYYQNSLPKPIENAYGRLINVLSVNRKPNRKPSRQERPKPLPGSQNAGVIDVKFDPETNTYQKPPGGKSNHPNELPPSVSPRPPASPVRTSQAFPVNTDLVTKGIVTLLFTALIISGFIGFSVINRDASNSKIDPDTGIVVPVEAENPASISAAPTPSNLLALADNAILDFQQTNDPENLIEVINELQELKNLQGGKLDSDGEEKLSKVKHKYAIEVLASRSQLKKAIELLGQIPTTYSDYQLIQDWLAKQL